MLQAPQTNSVQYTNTNHSECNEWHNSETHPSSLDRSPWGSDGRNILNPCWPWISFLPRFIGDHPFITPSRSTSTRLSHPLIDQGLLILLIGAGSKPESVSVDGRDWRIHLWSDALSIPPDLLMCLCRQHFFGSQKARRSESRWELHGGIHGMCQNSKGGSPLLRSMRLQILPSWAWNMTKWIVLFPLASKKNR